MRKILSFVLIFAVLAALIPALPVRASAAGTQVSASVDSLSPEAAGAYAKVLEDKMTEWPLVWDEYDHSKTWASDCCGLCYADLIDFEGDGVPELYLCMAQGIDKLPLEEIWRFNGSGAEKANLSAASIDFQFSRELVRKDGKVYLITYMNGGDSFNLSSHDLR